MEAAATPAPWYQASWKTEGQSPEGTELSRLLCFFNDEGSPRFWNWEDDGEFVAAMRNAFPALLSLARARLKTIEQGYLLPRKDAADLTP
jgi:hypothetical protein